MCASCMRARILADCLKEIWSLGGRTEGEGLAISGALLADGALACPAQAGPLFPAAVGLGTSMLIRVTFARMTPSKAGTSAESSTMSSHTTLLSPSFFLNRKW